MSNIKLRIPVGNDNNEVMVFSYPSFEDKKGRSKVEFQRQVIYNFLCEVFETSDFEIIRDESGAPFFNTENMPFLSISHSGNWFAVQLCEKDKVGIDIQIMKPDIERGMRYFVNQREEELLELTNYNLNLIWAAKEAVYKYKRGNLEFYKEAMTVVGIDNGTLTVEVEDEKVECAFLTEDNFVLVYIS